MARFKYILVENNLKQEVAIIFAREISHSKFKYSLNIISAGFFTIDNSNKIRLLEGSESLEMDPRINIDEKIILNTIQEESRYLIVIPDYDFKGTVVVLKDDFLYKKLFHYLETISFGTINIFNKKIISSNSSDDTILISSFIENGIML